MQYTAARSAVAFFMITIFAVIFPVQAQEVPVPETQTQIAISSPSYPVTSGDVYSLSYSIGATPVTYPIIIDYSYQIRVSNMAILNVAGKTYRQLKQDVETIVSKNYPLSGPQLIMVHPGTFSVYIKGEVRRATEQTTWAMGRLSSLIGSTLSEYSSIRNVTVTSANGRVKTYDLFKAQRFGDLSQDPYLRPGDVVTVSHLDRKVSVFGEVERPDIYELLPGENIRELIHSYGGGYTSKADARGVELTRYMEKAETFYLTEEEINADYPLKHSDAVYVPSR
ncbi:hypothetical protein FACS189442_1070 [Spirochaetia bacterium]|nr:hypothetical protein FACS189442_1070 [Spirochaetia bacterium]